MTATMTATTTIVTREDLQDDIRRVEMRLSDGFEKIQQAAEIGDDVARWEDHWLRLLREYELLYDQLAA